MDSFLNAFIFLPFAIPFVTMFVMSLGAAVFIWRPERKRRKIALSRVTPLLSLLDRHDERRALSLLYGCQKALERRTEERLRSMREQLRIMWELGGDEKSIETAAQELGVSSDDPLGDLLRTHELYLEGRASLEDVQRCRLVSSSIVDRLVVSAPGAALRVEELVLSDAAQKSLSCPALPPFTSSDE